MNNLHFYAMTAGIYDPAFTTGITNIVRNILTGIGPFVAAMLFVKVVVQGWMLMFGQASAASLAKALLQVLAVSAIVGVAFFTTWIQTPFMTDLPQWLAQIVNHNPNAQGIPDQLDTLDSAVLHLYGGMLQETTGYWPPNLVYRAQLGLILECIQGCLTVVFWAYEFSRGIMGLLICVGALVAALYVLEWARSIPMRVLSKAIGILILQAMLLITTQIVITSCLLAMRQSIGNFQLSLDEQVVVFGHLLWIFVFAAGFVVVLPAIAAYIGGGVSINAGTNMLLAYRNMRIPSLRRS